jgi:hypothetical protein
VQQEALKKLSEDMKSKGRVVVDFKPRECLIATPLE